MNIAQSFAQYLEDVTGATIGVDLFIGNAPDSDVAPRPDIWWIRTSGGAKIQSLATGEPIKAYTIDIFRRHRVYETVYNDLQDLEDSLNCEGCTQLDSFDTLNVEASIMSIDTDIDAEDRKIGLLQATITTIKEC